MLGQYASLINSNHELFHAPEPVDREQSRTSSRHNNHPLWGSTPCGTVRIRKTIGKRLLALSRF